MNLSKLSLLLLSFLFLFQSEVFSSENNGKIEASDIVVFGDLAATHLKKGVRKRNIRRMKNPVLKELASKMNKEQYNPGLKLAEYEPRSEEHTSELQSRPHLVCRLLLEKKK